MSAEIATLGRLAFSPVVAFNGTLTACDLLINFSRFAKGFNENIVDTNALRGTLSNFANRERITHYNVAPSLEMNPTALELARLLDWTMGGAPSGAGTITYPLGNGVRKLTAMYDDNNTVWHYDELAVSNFSIRSSANDPALTASLNLLGKQCTPGATFPVGLASSFVDSTTVPFQHTDTSGAVMVNSTATLADSIELDFDMGLDPERFFNAQYLTEFVKRDRRLGVRLTYPYGEYPSLYNAASAEGVGIPFVVTYTKGGIALTFTYPSVIFPRTPVEIQGRTEVMHQLNGTAYRTNASEAVVVTLDSTP